jgi:hypothetical protein
MLGIPATPGPVGYALFVAGLVLAAAAALAYWRRCAPRTGRVLAGATLAALAVTVGSGPFLAWRIVEDIRYTTSLDANYRGGAGPIQAYLAPYFLDEVAALLPPGATYYAATGASVPYPTARQAFPALALNTLFPRRSVADPRSADWLVAWGVRPATLAPVGSVRVVRPASGPLPPLRLARVRR